MLIRVININGGNGMDEFKSCIENYIDKVTDFSDKKILNIAKLLLIYRPLLTENEIENMVFIFEQLKMDYTLSFHQEPTNLSLIIDKQNTPMFKKQHEIEIIKNELIRLNNNDSDKLKAAIIKFLDASDHIEENEIISIEYVLKLINSDWYMDEIKNINNVEYHINFLPYRKQKNKKLVK